MCFIQQYAQIQVYRSQYIVQRRTRHLSTCAPSISTLTSRNTEDSTQSREGQDISVHLLRPSVNSHLVIQKIVYSLKKDKTAQYMCSVHQYSHIQEYRSQYIVLRRTGHFSTCAPSISTLTSRYTKGSKQQDRTLQYMYSGHKKFLSIKYF